MTNGIIDFARPLENAGARNGNAHSSGRLGNTRHFSSADNRCQIGIRDFAFSSCRCRSVQHRASRGPRPRERRAEAWFRVVGRPSGLRRLVSMGYSRPSRAPGHLLDAASPDGRTSTCPAWQVLILDLGDTWWRSAVYPTFCAAKDRVAAFLVAPQFACHGFLRKSDGSESQRIILIIPSGSPKCEYVIPGEIGERGG